jgi:predicted metallo-beta-lactamase superfamily hydrolase
MNPLEFDNFSVVRKKLVCTMNDALICFVSIYVYDTFNSF